LYADLLDHWQERNGEAVRQCDPALVDRARFSELFDLYGARDYGDHLIFTAGDMSPEQSPWRMLYEWSPDQHDRALGIDGFDSALFDEFAKPRITRAEDVRDLFVTNFWFRSSTRDPFLRTAVAESTDPLGAPLNVMLGSGAGSWQVPDVSAFLVEAHAAMESGRLTAREFHQTAFANAARFYTDTNPQFFRGTVIERDVDELLRTDVGLRSMGPFSQRHAGRQERSTRSSRQ
jgi:hypothetical protein